MLEARYPLISAWREARYPLIPAWREARYPLIPAWREARSPLIPAWREARSPLMSAYVQAHCVSILLFLDRIAYRWHEFACLRKMQLPILPYIIEPEFMAFWMPIGSRKALNLRLLAGLETLSIAGLIPVPRLPAPALSILLSTSPNIDGAGAFLASSCRICYLFFCRPTSCAKKAINWGVYCSFWRIRPVAKKTDSKCLVWISAKKLEVGATG